MSTHKNIRLARRRLVRAIDERLPLAVVRKRYAALVLATSETVSAAARMLGVTRRTVYRLLEKERNRTS